MEEIGGGKEEGKELEGRGGKAGENDWEGVKEIWERITDGFTINKFLILFLPLSKFFYISAIFSIVIPMIIHLSHWLLY